MLKKLKEILGLLSGYKQEYDVLKVEMEDIEPLIDDILFKLRNWYGTANTETGRSKVPHR